MIPEHLPDIALRVREHCVRMSGGGGSYIGSSLSCTDLLVYLYASGVLNVGPERTADIDRDIVLLSKGHAVPALYGTLVECGFFDRKRLENHLLPVDAIYWHPNASLPGVESHSGSLGHLLAVGAGYAYDAKLRGSRRRVIVIMGDGECNEGSVWESVLVCAALKLDNLILILDRNGIQANMRTEDLIPLESLMNKFESFGWQGCTVDGHDFADIDRAFQRFPFAGGVPSVLIARTIRGRGVSSVEDRVDRWFARFTEEEMELALAELRSPLGRETGGGE